MRRTTADHPSVFDNRSRTKRQSLASRYTSASMNHQRASARASVSRQILAELMSNDSANARDGQIQPRLNLNDERYRWWLARRATPGFSRTGLIEQPTRESLPASLPEAVTANDHTEFAFCCLLQESHKRPFSLRLGRYGS